MPALQPKLGELQSKAREKDIPLIIVFEGWGAAGKGTLINNLMLALDPRGFNVHLTKAANEEEILRPFLWRFWTKLPAKGSIAIFDRSWYRRISTDSVERILTKKNCAVRMTRSILLNVRLTDDGIDHFKFFLHISKKEQKKRFHRASRKSCHGMEGLKKRLETAQGVCRIRRSFR